MSQHGKTRPAARGPVRLALLTGKFSKWVRPMADKTQLSKIAIRRGTGHFTLI